MMRKQREIDMNNKNFAEMEQRMASMREQMNAMDDMERDDNGMTKEGAFEFRQACQAMFDAADAFDDWMMQEKKFGNKF